jgi:hypothetical protein
MIEQKAFKRGVDDLLLLRPLRKALAAIFDLLRKDGDA